MPWPIRFDPARERASEIMEHLCRWLKVSLDFGPANHPRGQGTVASVIRCSGSFAGGCGSGWLRFLRELREETAGWPAPSGGSKSSSTLTVETPGASASPALLVRGRRQGGWHYQMKRELHRWLWRRAVAFSPEVGGGDGRVACTTGRSEVVVSCSASWSPFLLR